MTPDQFNQAVSLLVPYMNEEDRKTIVLQALWGKPVLDKIEFKGNPYNFTVNLLETLIKRGDTQDILILIETVKSSVSQHKQQSFDELIYGLQQSAPPLSESEEPNPQGVSPPMKRDLRWRGYLGTLGTLMGLLIALFGIIQSLPPSRQTQVWLALRLITETPTWIASSTASVTITPSHTSSATNTASPNLEEPYTANPVSTNTSTQTTLSTVAPSLTNTTAVLTTPPATTPSTAIYATSKTSILTRVPPGLLNVPLTPSNLLVNLQNKDNRRMAPNPPK